MGRLDTLVLFQVGPLAFSPECFFDVSPACLCIHTTKDNVNLLQCALLGFRHKKKYKNTHGQAEYSKHDKCTPTHAVNGQWCNLCYDEIEKPLSGGCGIMLAADLSGFKIGTHQQVQLHMLEVGWERFRTQRPKESGPKKPSIQ